MEKIKEFVTVQSGDGDGYGIGNGIGNGSGYGSGHGYGHGYGNGSGYGIGNGNGNGYGHGYGYGSGVKSINGMSLYNIDGIQTIITSIHKNVAKGLILNSDLTFTSCYVVKQNNTFAHGKTIQKAMQALQDKQFKDMSEEERIEEFLKHFSDTAKKYPVSEFYEWHNKLTGSCEMGRKQFAKEHDIDIDNDEMTVSEFIKITKNSFGGEIIRKLENEVEQV